MNKKLTIVYTGNYSKGKGYPRTNVLLEGLSLYSNLKEVRYPLWEEGEDKEKGIKKPYKKVIPFLKSLGFFLKNIDEFKNSDAVFVGFPGYFEVLFFKFLQIITGSNFKIFFDYFFSVYESLVFERKVLRKGSILAKLLFLIDKAGLIASDKVLIDTEQHRDFLCKTFNVKKEKFIVVPVGESERYFTFLPYPERKDPFNVLFFGTFLNLHGIDRIKETIQLLKNKRGLRFILIGRGKNDYLFKENKIEHIEFINTFLAPEELKGYIKKSHLILGIFGDNERANIVIPCKIYDALACGRPVITGETDAAKKMFNDKEFVSLCKNTPQAIANEIERFFNMDNQTLEKLGIKAHKFFKKNFSPEIIGLKLIKEVEIEVQR